MSGELREAFAKADADDSVRAIVLTGAGRGFCAGADMARLSSAAAGKTNLRNEGDWPTEGLAANFAQRCSYILGVKKPVIAGINGAVAGIGLVLTLYCDIRYMAAGAKLTTAFARRGLIAEHGISWMLPRLIGPDERDGPAAVRAHGDRPRRPPPWASCACCRRRASPRPCRRAPPRSPTCPRRAPPASSRSQVYEALFQSLAEATVIANREQEICRDTEDFREGVAHYVEKRAPKFTGR